MIGDPRAVDPLIQVRKEGDLDVIASAEEVLDKLNNTQAVKLSS
jgi:HEAT repeat protein